MSKTSFLAGVGVGYVLGARAGRQRYEQIRSGARGVWHNPKVQETVSHAQDLAAQKGPEVGHKIAETATAAAHKASAKVSGGTTGEDDTGTAHSGSETPPGFVENPAKN